MSSCHTRIACHGKGASPVVGRAVYAFIPEVFLSCPLILLRWQVWLLPHPKRKLKNLCWGTEALPLPPLAGWPPRRCILSCQAALLWQAICV